MNDRHAIVVLPPGAGGRIADAGLRRWLSRGRIALNPQWAGPFDHTLAAIEAPAAEGSRAALRYWGHTGKRPERWIAGADPVSLRPRMRDLVVDALPPQLLPSPHLREIFASLQEQLASGDEVRFELIGHAGYLSGDSPFRTPDVMPDAIDGRVPDSLVANGGSLDRFRQFDTEIQMVLHDHPVNRRRQTEGLPPVNALWLWGGGFAPAAAQNRLPALFADDALFAGYWLANGQPPGPWPGDVRECGDAAGNGFVAVVPRTGGQAPDEWLLQSRALLQRGRIRRLTLVFRDGLCVEIRRLDRLRRWKPVSPLLEEQSREE